MKLLMHTCCAPCSVYCIDKLREEGIEPTIYWYNPNIHPYSEYEARKNCLIEYANRVSVEAIFEDEYGLDAFCKNVSNNVEARCVQYCYPIRLRKTFEYAKEHGYTHVTTTLLYSIYQKHEFIKKLMEQYSKEYGIEFLYRDFRYGFWEGHEKAKEAGLYMQKYCGCIYSEEESAYKGENTKPVLPEGMEYPKNSRPMVRKITNKNDYIDLLLEADPSLGMINKYLSKSDVYGLEKDGDIVCIAVFLPVSDKVIELKNIATKECYRGKGYATTLLKAVCGNYKQKYEKMIVDMIVYSKILNKKIL